MIYLLLVVGVAVFVYLATWGWLHDPDGGASFAGVWLIVVTFPASLVLTEVLAETGGLPGFAWQVVAGLVQAALLFLLCWWLDRRLT